MYQNLIEIYHCYEIILPMLPEHRTLIRYKPGATIGEQDKSNNEFYRDDVYSVHGMEIISIMEDVPEPP